MGPPLNTKIFVNSLGLTTDEAEILLKQYGLHSLPEKNTPHWYIFKSLLWQPMPIMIWLAAIIEAVISNWFDMGILLFIQFASAGIASCEASKAGDIVAALKASRKLETTAKRDGELTKMNASHLVPGDLVLLASGSAIPADCRQWHCRRGSGPADRRITPCDNARGYVKLISVSIESFHKIIFFDNNCQN